MRAKICGITNLEDALFAANSGAWAIGFNFYKKSPRYILPTKAKEICLQLPKHIITVGILIDSSKEEIVNTLKFIDFIQVYQHDSTLLLEEKKRLILALQTSSREKLPEAKIMQEYCYLLLDAPKQADGLLGGTGRLANWDLAKELAKDYKLILAGGLNNANIKGAIDYVQPFGVDVASGVEKSPGIKDPSAVKEFLNRCTNDR